MLVEISYFGDPSTGHQEPLNRAYTDFTSWRKLCRVPSSQRSFSAKSLERESYGYYLNAKGYNSRVIAEWLLRKVIDVNRSDQFRAADNRSHLCEIALSLVSKPRARRAGFSVIRPGKTREIMHDTHFLAQERFLYIICSPSSRVSEAMDAESILSTREIMMVITCVVIAAGTLLLCTNLVKQTILDLRNHMIEENQNKLQTQLEELRDQKASLEIEIDRLRSEMGGTRNNIHRHVVYTTKTGLCWHADVHCQHLKSVCAVHLQPCKRCVH